MPYMTPATTKATKIGPFMSSRMDQIKVLLEQIEDVKRKILLLQFDENEAYAVKTQKLAEMQKALLQMEHVTCALMHAEINKEAS